MKDTMQLQLLVLLCLGFTTVHAYSTITTEDYWWETSTYQPDPETTTRQPEPDLLECGGIIDIPRYVGEITTVAYKQFQTYANNERCLWALNSDNELRNGFTVELSLTESGAESCCDGISAFTRNPDGTNLTSIVMDASDITRRYTLEGPNAYLSFTSDHSVTGQGFVLQILTVSFNVGSPVENRHYSNYPGISNYGPFQQQHQVSIIVNPPQHKTSFRVDFLLFNYAPDCQTDDILEVYEIAELGHFNTRASLCGNFAAPPEASFQSKQAILILFKASQNGTTDGFRVTWESN